MRVWGGVVFVNLCNGGGGLVVMDCLLLGFVMILWIGVFWLKVDG